MSALIDDDACAVCGDQCLPWTCGNCGATACSRHEENCPECAFPRLHRFRDLKRRAKLQRDVDQLLRGEKRQNRWHRREGA